MERFFDILIPWSCLIEVGSRNAQRVTRKQSGCARIRSVSTRRAVQWRVWIYETMIKRWPWSTTITEMVTRGNQVNWQIAIDRRLVAARNCAWTTARRFRSRPDDIIYFLKIHRKRRTASCLDDSRQTENRLASIKTKISRHKTNQTYHSTKNYTFNVN